MCNTFELEIFSLRRQTEHWIGAQFCVCMFLDSRDKSLNMFQKVSGFYKQNFSGFRIHITVALIFSAHLFCCGFRNKLILLVVLDSVTVSAFHKM